MDGRSRSPPLRQSPFPIRGWTREPRLLYSPPPYACRNRVHNTNKISDSAKKGRERERERQRKSAVAHTTPPPPPPPPPPLSPSVALLPQSDLSSPFPIPEETLTAYRPRARDAGRCRSRRRRAVAVVGDPGSIGHEGRGFDRKDVDLSGSGPRSCFRRRISGRSSGFFENLLNFNDAFLSSDGGLRSWSWAG
ncbi:hypothetical protein BHE74_00042934 [Ensete ventricosum]|nr:hypothetical protein GW17_00032523 [Ensete ventricosum]RWW50773.1 hypothetical protein BHE74_00042934 [Ensete ventricosum]